ncbi:MAG: lysophospholipid acyltransferase family protein [Betaproteobacteria bacterium]
MIARTTVALPIQAWRAARVSAHVLVGIATTTFVFPRVSADRRRELTRRWCRRLLPLMHVEARVVGAIDASARNVMIVANHISWLDIFALNAEHPARFVAKSELARWPLVGRLIRGSGTMFIERARRQDMLRVNDQAADALRTGDAIVVFPEGTTTDGTAVLKFHGALLQPIVETQGELLPVAIFYHDGEGSLSLAPEYAGDTSFAASFWRVCGERRLAVCLIAAPAIPAAGMHRRELARAAEDAIRTALAAWDAATAPGTSADPEA